MERIDSHQYFLNKEHKLDKNKITRSLNALYLPEDLKIEMQLTGITGSIAVQLGETLDEATFLLELANKKEFIKGVIGRLNLSSKTIEAQLKYLSVHPKFVGVTHRLEKTDLYKNALTESFLKNASLMGDYHLALDIQTSPAFLKAIKELAVCLPELKIIICHLGEPDIKNGVLIPWADDIYELSKHSNIYCKISGMFNLAKSDQWKYEDFISYLSIILEAFGHQRIMFGSDWPLCLQFAEYKDVVKILEDFTSTLPDDFIDMIWGENAIEAYGLK